MRTSTNKAQLFLIFLGGVLGLLLFTALGYHLLTRTKTIPITFSTPTQNVVVIAEIADTPIKQQQGLMYRERMGANNAMLFPYKEEQILPFWMKNMKINLDIIFLNKDKEIVTIFKQVPVCKANPCPHYTNSKPAQYVIEVQAGFVDKYKINKSTKIAF